MLNDKMTPGDMTTMSFVGSMTWHSKVHILTLPELSTNVVVLSPGHVTWTLAFLYVAETVFNQIDPFMVNTQPTQCGLYQCCYQPE